MSDEQKTNALQARQLAMKINSIIRNRMAAFLGRSHEGRRDLYEAFGYEREVTTAALLAIYQRNDIANRIVRAFPQATWREKPIIRDDEGAGLEEGQEGFSKFAAEAEEFFRKKKLYQQIEIADRISSIGRYGVLYLGFADAKDAAGLRQPLATGSFNKLTHISAYMDTDITIGQWEANEASPRYGQPLMYTLGATDAASTGWTSVPRKALTVHHSRVIHIAEFLDSDKVFGLPRLLPIYNRLKDIEKVVGGSAETFWNIANRGIAFMADKDAEIDETVITNFKNDVQAFTDGLDRQIVGGGFTPHVLGSESPSMEFILAGLLDLIAGTCGIPKRILIGSERGELSSSQDENNFAARVEERRAGFASDQIVMPLVEILLATGNLKAKPVGDFWCEWPEGNSLPETEQATIAATKATALATYANSPGATMIVPESEFREKFLGLPASPETKGFDLDDEDDFNEEEPDIEPEAFKRNNDPSVKSLYAYRPVRNWKAIDKWAKSQGLDSIKDKMHVTLCYSKKAVDWSKLFDFIEEENDGSVTIIENKGRTVQVLGNAVVIAFPEADLAWRNMTMKWAGVGSDFDNYQPHISITYDRPEGFDPKKIKPYLGPIVLDAECFEEIKDPALVKAEEDAD